MQARLSLFLILSIYAIQASAAPKVSVSIKPLHSLVSMVMKGVAKPGLIITGSEDPHHTSLRPSQRRQIATADLIVWTGEQLEASLAKPIRQSKGISIELLQTRLPDTYSARTTHHDHDSDTSTDPHIWLSPTNAKHVLKVVTETLGLLDAANRSTYERNRDRAIDRIDDLVAELEFELSVPNKTYIAHHDAYQYFEQTFGLDAAGFIRDSEDAAASARQISKLRHMVELRKVNCIIYDGSVSPDIIDSLGRTERTRVLRVPTLGLEFNASEDLWFDLMKQATRQFRKCLQ